MLPVKLSFCICRMYGEMEDFQKNFVEWEVTNILFLMFVQLAVIRCSVLHIKKHVTYSLTAWSRVLLEKLTGFAANQEIPRLLWNP